MVNVKSHLSDYAPPGGREPPREVVALLREINPDVELLYRGRGQWSLGTVRHDKVIRERVARSLWAYNVLLTQAAPGAQAHIDPGARPIVLTDGARQELMDRLWAKKLQYQGFRLVTHFGEELLNTAIVGAYQKARWTRRNREAAAAVEAEQSKPIDGAEDQIAQVRARHDQEHRSVHRFAFRHQESVHFDVPDYDERIGRVATPAGV